MPENISSIWRVFTIRGCSHRAKRIAEILWITVALTAAMLISARLAAPSSSPLAPPAPTQPGAGVPPPSVTAAQTPEGSPQVVQRTVTVTFDYDFSSFPACSPKVTTKCIQQFDVLEVSDPANEVFLFTIPAPPNAKGLVKGITFTSPKKRSFFTGPHRIGVSAKAPPPFVPSDPLKCMVFVQVLPDSPAATTPPTSSSSPPK